MNGVLELELQRILPAAPAVLQAQGVRDPARVTARARDVAAQAIQLLAVLARPLALLEEVDGESVAEVYAGEGLNDSPAPMEDILPQARHRALMAATLGQPVSAEIERRFADGDLALAAALDAAASEAADNIGSYLALRFRDMLSARGELAAGGAVSCYSPGYCGWHISAQRGLLTRLRPERIDLFLLESCLMRPLKSVSGVLLEAPAVAHRVRPRYGFCVGCRGRSCLSPARQFLTTLENTA